MKHLFDQDDERAVLDELTRNQQKAELLGQAYKQQGQPKTAASWIVSAQQIGCKIELLAGIFQHKN
jgi:hypothetical protein